ncbi:MAG: methyltransferase [Bacteroidia bacterium]|nr:methyltransferase [Bacteroidia bacterium]
MDSRERFFATINYEKTDRPASWLGLPVPAAEKNLFRHFGVSSVSELKQKLGDDIWPIEVPFNCPPANHIACAFAFAKSMHNDTPDERTLTAPGFFEDYDDPSNVDKFNWPDPSGMVLREESLRLAKEIPNDKISMGVMWSAHFQDACSAFGMEKALITMMMNPEMFQAVIDRITDFYLKANELFYDATKGHLDAVLIGNDFGSQTGLMVDPESLRKFVFPGTKKIIDQAKSYGLKVIHHSCGSIFPIIGDLARLGADVIHPIQALAANMEPQRLKTNFEKKVAFCGGIDAQHLLVNQKPEDVRAKVRELMEIFPTGLILSPSHEAILQDIPPANIEAIFSTLKEYKA